MANISPEPRLLARLTEKQADLVRYQPLAFDTKRLLHEHLRILLTYHSNIGAK
jgi:hypothetical protein